MIEFLMSSDLTELNDPSTWPEPQPFPRSDPPAFPVENLPGPMADYVRALSVSTQTSPEMAGALALGVLAGMFQSRFCVRAKADYVEPLALFVLCVASPGERKSAVLGRLTQPLRAYETQRQQRERAEVALSLSKRDILEKQLEQAKTDAARNRPSLSTSAAEAQRIESDKLRMERLTRELEMFEVKAPYRLIIDDATPEKLIDIMDEQNGAIALVSAEGGLFDALGGRYEKSLNLDVYLKGHAGDDLRVDRIGRRANHIPSPKLTLLLAVQPDVLTGLMHNSTLRGRGLCARFLYTMCASFIGSRDFDAAPVPDDVEAAYAAFVQRHLDGAARGDLTLDEEARALLSRFADKVELRLEANGDWANMRDWGGKFVGTALRIAGLLHAADRGDEAPKIPIDKATLKRGIWIADCLAGHAVVAYRAMGADTRLDDAKFVLGKLMGMPVQVTRRELHKKTRKRHGFTYVSALEEPLRLLQDMEYIRQYDVDNHTESNAVLIVRNPRLLAQDEGEILSSGDRGIPRGHELFS